MTALPTTIHAAMQDLRGDTQLLADVIADELEKARTVGQRLALPCSAGCGQPSMFIVDAHHAYCATCVLPVLDFLGMNDTALTH